MAEVAPQSRIVADVDTQMALCGHVVVSFTAVSCVRICALKALLAEADAAPDARDMEAAE